jgi:hypothetical protein
MSAHFGRPESEILKVKSNKGILEKWWRNKQRRQHTKKRPPNDIQDIPSRDENPGYLYYWENFEGF